jgi:hypothetical protein
MPAPGAHSPRQHHGAPPPRADGAAPTLRFMHGMLSAAVLILMFGAVAASAVVVGLKLFGLGGRHGA